MWGSGIRVRRKARRRIREIDASSRPCAIAKLFCSWLRGFRRTNASRIHHNAPQSKRPLISKNMIGPRHQCKRSDQGPWPRTRGTPFGLFFVLCVSDNVVGRREQPSKRRRSWTSNPTDPTQCNVSVNAQLLSDSAASGSIASCCCRVPVRWDPPPRICRLAPPRRPLARRAFESELGLVRSLERIERHTTDQGPPRTLPGAAVCLLHTTNGWATAVAATQGLFRWVAAPG